MQRFFLPPGSLRSGASVALDDYAHQLYSVLRLAPGAPLLLLDDSGLEYEATLQELAPRRALARVGASRPSAGEPALRVTLYCCTLKADKFEWVLQKSVELGVARFVPVVSRRSVVRPAAALANKVTRWHQIVREAAEQSGRGRLPVVEQAVDYTHALADARTAALRLLAWESASASAPLAASLAARSSEGPIALLTGPEGGLDSAEVDTAAADGWQVVSLGSRTLRAETAAIAGLAALMALAGELGSFSA